MTGDAATELLREALAERLPRELDDVVRTLIAANLLPVVEAECRRRAAEELRAAAEALKWLIVTDDIGNPMDVVRDLRARADAIEGQS